MHFSLSLLFKVTSVVLKITFKLANFPPQLNFFKKPRGRDLLKLSSWNLFDELIPFFTRFKVSHMLAPQFWCVAWKNSLAMQMKCAPVEWQPITLPPSSAQSKWQFTGCLWGVGDACERGKLGRRCCVAFFSNQAFPPLWEPLGDGLLLLWRASSLHIVNLRLPSCSQAQVSLGSPVKTCWSPSCAFLCGNVVQKRGGGEIMCFLNWFWCGARKRRSTSAVKLISSKPACSFEPYKTLDPHFSVGVECKMEIRFPNSPPFFLLLYPLERELRHSAPLQSNSQK